MSHRFFVGRLVTLWCHSWRNFARSEWIDGETRSVVRGRVIRRRTYFLPHGDPTESSILIPIISGWQLWPMVSLLMMSNRVIQLLQPMCSVAHAVPAALVLRHVVNRSSKRTIDDHRDVVTGSYDGCHARDPTARRVRLVGAPKGHHCGQFVERLACQPRAGVSRCYWWWL